jgi:hypothetical protein
MNTDQCLVTNTSIFQAALNLHVENNPFEFYDLGLSDEDKLFLSTVKITKDDSELIGEFDQENNFFSLKNLQDKSKISLEQLVKCQSKSPVDCAEYLSKLIDRIVNNLVKTIGYDDAGIIIRVGNTIDYEWHIDLNSLEHIDKTKSYIKKHIKGHTTPDTIINTVINQSILKAKDALNSMAYPSKEAQEDKAQSEFAFVFNLIGDPTLLYKATPKEKENFFTKQYIAAEDIDSSKIFTAPDGHGSTFYVGNKIGTIHSAPKSENDRLIVLVAPEHSNILNTRLQLAKIMGMLENAHKNFT